MSIAPSYRLKHISDRCKSAPPKTDRVLQRRAHMVEAAHDMFIEEGVRAVTLRHYAFGTGYSQTIICREYGDMQHLLYIVLRDHLNEIIKQIGQVPAGAELHRRRRAAYYAATRTIMNSPATLHRIFLRDRFGLPDDLLALLEQHRIIVGGLLGEDAEATLAALDTPTWTLVEIEGALAGAAGATAAARHVVTAAGLGGADGQEAPQAGGQAADRDETASPSQRRPALFSTVCTPSALPDLTAADLARDRPPYPRMTPEQAANNPFRTVTEADGEFSDEDLERAIADDAGAQPEPLPPASEQDAAALPASGSPDPRYFRTQDAGHPQDAEHPHARRASGNTLAERRIA